MNMQEQFFKKYIQLCNLSNEFIIHWKYPVKSQKLKKSYATLN